jgi:hypothetical protein
VASSPVPLIVVLRQGFEADVVRAREIEREARVRGSQQEHESAARTRAAACGLRQLFADVEMIAEQQRRRDRNVLGRAVLREDRRLGDDRRGRRDRKRTRRRALR